MRYKLKSKRVIDYTKVDEWLPKIYSYDINGRLINIYYGRHFLCFDTFVYEDNVLVSHYQENLAGEKYGTYEYIYTFGRLSGVRNQYGIFIEYTFDTSGFLAYSFKRNNSGTNTRVYHYDGNEIERSTNSDGTVERLFYYKIIKYLEYV